MIVKISVYRIILYLDKSACILTGDIEKKLNWNENMYCC